jgi:hypothetical protein
LSIGLPLLDDQGPEYPLAPRNLVSRWSATRHENAKSPPQSGEQIKDLAR